MRRLSLTVFYASAILTINYVSSWAYDTPKEVHSIQQDSVIVSASHRYERLNPIKWFFMGTNYREVWSTPVKMRVFHLNSTKGGFTIDKMGGGEQTKSLKLLDKKGGEWVLRMIDKDVKAALPKSLQNTFVRGIVQDQISAAFPYAPLTITDLSKATAVIVTPNELYYVPDDKALGKYREIFAHQVCLLEPEPSKMIKREPLKTDDVHEQLKTDNRYAVLQENMLRSRLLDMLIADWDRHKNQWDWSSVDSGDTKYFYPIPEDRDQAYFNSTGALVKIVRLFGLPHLLGFKENIKNLKKLNNKVHPFDRYFMSELDRKDWERIIKKFQADLPDELIHTAVKKLPPEIYEINGKEMEEKLISRRNGLLKNGLEYYEFLAKTPVINGTEMVEHFQIYNYEDSTIVAVKRKSDKKIIFKRTFYTDETEEIQFLNSGKNDIIDVAGKNEIELSWLPPDTEKKKGNKF